MAGRWVPAEVCAALVEEAVRESLSDRFFKGTVDDAVTAARSKAAALLEDLEGAETDSAAHDGPVRPDCPLKCLGLSSRAFNALRRFENWSKLDAPSTVGEVAALASASKLEDARHLGVKGVAEIEQALRLAGFSGEVDGHRHDRPADGS